MPFSHLIVMSFSYVKIHYNNSDFAKQINIFIFVTSKKIFCNLIAKSSEKEKNA